MTQPWSHRLVASFITAISMLLGVASPLLAQTNYRLVPIDAALTPAYDINDEGTVVGFYVFGDPSGNRGYRWTELTGALPLVSNPADINKFPIFGSDQVLAINRGGTVVGRGAETGGVPFVPTVLSPDGVFTFLPPSESPSIAATARSINSGGAVVGKSRANNQAGFYWTEATGFEQITQADFNTFYAQDAFDVNDVGVVVGWCTGSECGPAPAAYLWSRAAGHFVLPKVAGFSNHHHEAFAINERNEVVGRYGTVGVFFWSAATGTIDLGAPAGLPMYIDINDRGQIVATITANGGGSVAYLYSNGTWTDLNTFLPPGETFHIDTVRAINNNGWIVGSGEGPLLAGYVLIPPTVDVTVNGADGPLTLGPADPLQVSIGFDGGNGGLLTPAEIYSGVSTPFGLYWITPSGFSLTPTRLYAGPLPSFASAPLLGFASAGSLPPGTYAWITIVDHDTNGVIDADFFDYVVTIITP